MPLHRWELTRFRTVFRSHLVQGSFPSPASVRPLDARSELFAQVLQVPLGPSFPIQQANAFIWHRKHSPLVPTPQTGSSVLPVGISAPTPGELLSWLCRRFLRCGMPCPLRQNSDCFFLKDTTQKDARPCPLAPSGTELLFPPAAPTELFKKVNHWSQYGKDSESP